MIFRPARASDFAHVETFVWQVIFPSFDREELTDEQRAENDAMVEQARTQVQGALEASDTEVFVAIEPKTKALAGYVIADATPRAYAEIPLIVVHRKYQGKGVAAKLLAEATNYIGADRAVSLAVRHYNARAIAFFAKHGFVDTGETTGDHPIPRTLLLREANEVPHPEAQPTTAADPADSWADFPTGADEPVPVYEALPDYTLTVDDTPLFETGANALATTFESDFASETTLTDKQLTELEAFIARAKARKGLGETDNSTANPPAPVNQATKSATTRRADVPSAAPKRPTASPTYDPGAIEFEVDYGERPAAGATPQQHTAVAEDASRAAATSGPSFEFAFGAPTAPPAEAPEEKPRPVAAQIPVAAAAAVASRPSGPKISPEKSAPKTKSCPDCATTLPAAARFCFSCGYPQPLVATPPGAGSETTTPLTDDGEDFLELVELTDDAANEAITTTSPAASRAKSNPTDERGIDEPTTEQPEHTPTRKDEKQTTDPFAHLTLADLKGRFRSYLNSRVIAYFGKRRLPKYQSILEKDTAFQTMRDGSLGNLLPWLTESSQSAKDKQRRLTDTLADLTEYFIVETAADLHKGVLPQRLLRHQSVDWNKVDLFQLVMDYLDFERESEVIYTDFVTMPARALRNATRSFLSAGKDERIFFICDQSLVSQAKNGFAVTDSGLYWKNVLQPAGAIMYNELNSVRIHDGHLDLDDLFFNAGGTLNLKLALLLDKLRRMY